MLSSRLDRQTGPAFPGGAPTGTERHADTELVVRVQPRRVHQGTEMRNRLAAQGPHGAGCAALRFDGYPPFGSSSWLQEKGRADRTFRQAAGRDRQ